MGGLYTCVVHLVELAISLEKPGAEPSPFEPLFLSTCEMPRRRRVGTLCAATAMRGLAATIRPTGARETSAVHGTCASLAVHGVRRCVRSTATRLTCERRVRRERSGARGRSRRVDGGGHACSPRARSMSVDLSRRWRSLRVHTSVPPVHEDVVDERTCQGTGSPEWVKRDDSYRPSGRARR